MTGNRLVVAFCLNLIAAAAWADVNLKPGTWEMTMSLQGLPMTMPPTKVNYCATKDKPVPREPRQEHDCKHHSTTTGNTVNWEMTCANGMQGKGQVTYAGDKMTGTQEMQMKGRNGQMQTLSTKIEGRWLKAECEANKAKAK